MPGLSEWPCAAAAGHRRGDSVARSGWGGGWRERRRRGVTGGRRPLERIGGFCPPGCVIPASETSEALRLPLPPSRSAEPSSCAARSVASSSEVPVVCV